MSYLAAENQKQYYFEGDMEISARHKDATVLQM